MSVKDWSVTPAANGAFFFPENQLPSTVNNDGRGVMAAIAEWYAQIAGGGFSGVVSGTADAIVLTTTPSIGAYAVNQRFFFKATGPNTLNNPTINVSGLGAKTLVGPSAAVLSVPAWSANDMIQAVYDGTNMMVMGLPASQLPQRLPRNVQTGTSYTYVTGDRAHHVVHSNALAIAGTLPAAGVNFPDGWYTLVENLGAGILTITGAINAGTAYVLRQMEWVILTSDGAAYLGIGTGQTTGLPFVREAGTRGIPINLQNASYGLVLSDCGGSVYHSDATARVYTIPANATIAFPIGSAITVINGAGAGALTISITTDTLLRGDGTAGTGSRTVAASSVVTLLKIDTTTWIITGVFT